MKPASAVWYLMSGYGTVSFAGKPWDMIDHLHVRGPSREPVDSMLSLHLYSRLWKSPRRLDQGAIPRCVQVQALLGDVMLLVPHLSVLVVPITLVTRLRSPHDGPPQDWKITCAGQHSECMPTRPNQSQQGIC
jgi:hypothetical protein